ncbi:hypothetical protein T02_15472 [Trichinella nativa]|uniref:Uncharacterized protein n=1 Tax=Trichinella nativa TaxID=6335 RepID=A0A0V1LL52_9BILA|nr:hypothetical protein T02_15472 [Trichinella nativa]
MKSENVSTAPKNPKLTQLKRTELIKLCIKQKAAQYAAMQGFGSAQDAAHDENGDQGQNQMTKSENAVGNLQADERDI